MANSGFTHFCLLFLLAFLFTSSFGHGSIPQSKDHVALFIFGDSLFDAGNNKYINTSASYKANYWPYGETFFRHPTGRHCDGRLIPDFIAEYAKLPLLLPYKQPGSNLLLVDGVNFASGGAGALVETHQGYVIDLKTQLNYFKKVVKLLDEQYGGKEAKRLLSKAVYLFSIGSNDYIVPFMGNSSLLQLHSQEEYVDMVIGNFTDVIKEIYKMGGRKYGFLGLGPLGCLPFSRALNFTKNNVGGCLEEMNDLVKLHNLAFSKVLKKLEKHLQGFKYSNFNFYTTLMERMENPSKYGFKDGKNACCGSGPYRGILTCGEKEGVNSCGGRRGIKEHELCSNRNDRVFFDYVHPSDVANQQLSKLMWNGNGSLVGPYNLKTLFEF
ncbi:hypothetical protein NMG60_11004007 [Bertholletia excelsa]